MGNGNSGKNATRLIKLIKNSKLKKKRNYHGISVEMERTKFNQSHNRNFNALSIKQIA